MPDKSNYLSTAMIKGIQKVSHIAIKLLYSIKYKNPLL